jgi:3-hydroxyacyl-[acyl-carrier-protein] dehydratase
MMSEDVLGVADIHEILRLLPHRYPFLLVDRVIGMRGDQHGIGIKHVTMNEPQFVGHFPENPVMPGVLVIEGMAQTACVLALRLMPPTDKGRVMFFLTIDKAKFRKPARPGDTLEYHVDKITQRRNMWWYRGEAKVDGVLVAEAELGAYLTEE